MVCNRLKYYKYKAYGIISIDDAFDDHTPTHIDLVGGVLDVSGCVNATNAGRRRLCRQGPFGVSDRLKSKGKRLMGWEKGLCTPPWGGKSKPPIKSIGGTELLIMGCVGVACGARRFTPLTHSLITHSLTNHSLNSD